MSRGQRIRAGLFVVVGVVLVLAVASSVFGWFKEPAWFDCKSERTSRPTAKVEEVDPPTGVGFDQLAEIPGSVNMSQDPSTGDWWVVVQQGQLVKLTPDGDQSVELEIDVAHENEQGLLGVAVAPDSQHLYLYYTDPDGDSHLVEYELADGDLVKDSERELLFVEQPRASHNAGTLRFGPDGYLWIALGDGGGAEGPQTPLGRRFGGGSTPRGKYAQDTSNLYGSILRIDPTPDGDKPYTIPDDNPFAGDADARGEVWAYGLRNPWQYSIDAQTGDLWIGDVGQECWEEVDVVRGPDGGGAGTNFGWGHYEAQHRFEGAELDQATLPVLELPHSEGYCTVVAGSVYRGEALPDLDGWFLFTDSCNSDLRAARERDDGTWEVANFDTGVGTPVAFAEDADHEIYVLSLGGGPFKLVPPDEATG
jgi:glucose/arabinose dehydrogenase